MRIHIIILSLLFLGLGIFLNSTLISATQTYKSKKEKYAQTLNYKERFFDKDEWLNPDKRNPKLSKASRQLTEIQELEQSQNQRKNIVWGVYLAFLIFIMVNYFLKKSISEILFQLSILALVCLHAGLFIPMLEIAAFERNLDLGEIPISTKIMGIDVNFNFEKQFQGDMYFYYQSKSIKELIVLLLEQKNYLVGISILFFSVIFPLIKTLLTILISFKNSLSHQKWYKLFVAHLGKWSMADVFVVAIFLSFLAFQNMQVGINTESKVLMGLYFFLAYCFLSIISSSISTRLHKDF